MNLSKKFLISLTLGVLVNSVSATELPQQDSITESKSPIISNLNVRFMLRSDVKGIFENEEHEINMLNKPSMVGVAFDMGEKFSFYSRYRFDFPTTIQSDGTPMSLLAFYLQYNASDKLKFTAGKQVMMHGSYEFDYCPIDVFYYSLMGDYVQGFVTGASANYSSNGQQYGLQITKPVDSNFLWDNSKNGVNATFRYIGDFFNGFYKPLWSYTYTYAGDKKSLNNFMLGNQFNFNKLKVEIDLMKQDAFRYYQQDGDNNIQQRTNEYSFVGFAEYQLPGNRFLLGGKYAYDKRELAENGEEITNAHTISAQLRYRLSKKYGITLHTTAAHKISETPENYRYSFSNNNANMFSVGAVWDFTYRKR